METSASHHVFIAGATGYLGRALVPRLIERGHQVCGLCRNGSERKLPAGCGLAMGDALDAASYASQIPPADTFVHLVGVSHPSPWKTDQFRAVDLRSIQASISAAKQAQIRHFVYVSVAHPAPMMKSYISVRQECESLLRASGLAVTILRPWYVLGPGHRWPYALLPVYWLAERLPASRDGAQRLGLVSLSQMTAALLQAVEEPTLSTRVLRVPDIRGAGVKKTSPDAR